MKPKREKFVVHELYRKSTSQFKILGARRVTRNSFHTEDPQILGATAQNYSPGRPGALDFGTPDVIDRRSGVFSAIKQKQRAPGRSGGQISWGGAQYLCVLSLELTSCHPFGAWNLEAAPRFLEKHAVCNMVLSFNRIYSWPENRENICKTASKSQPALEPTEAKN
jgi:hypothetical protein